jgi:hypothetical protein
MKDKYELIGKVVNKHITTRQQTKKFILKEFSYEEIKNMIDNNRMNNLKSFYNHIIVDWETINPILNVCGFRVLKTKSKKSNARGTLNSSGNMANFETIAMFPYSKRIHLYRYIDNSGAKRNGIFIDIGWECNHIKPDSKHINTTGNIEVMPQWLNKAEYILKGFVMNKSKTQREMDIIVTKYRKLSNLTTTLEELKELRDEFVKETKIIITDKESGFDF